MIKSKKQMFTIIGAFALVLLLGTTTYAFFNYTRTGVANTIRTGRIYFNTTQSGTLNVTDLFPMSSVDAASANLDAVTVRIQGDTTYAQGEEYRITVVGVNNVVNNKTIPISYIASYAPTPVQEGDPNTVGSSSGTYYTSRGSTTALYTLNATGVAATGTQILAGYIPSGATGIDGTLTIKAYLDSTNIAISDTYDATDPGTDNMGTTSEWVNNRVVLTTAEWNALQNTQTPLSFKIRAESNEGTWVPNPGSATMSLSPASGTVYLDGTITTTSTITTNGDGNITCVSDDDLVATCSVTGTTLTITGEAAGTAEITVTEAAGTLYLTPATATYNITVETTTP